MNPRIALCCTILVLAVTLKSQDLDPRAYVHVPIDATLLIVGGAYSQGSVLTDPTLPLENLQATVVTGSLGIGRTFALFGQTAQVVAVMPYSSVDASATVRGSYESVNRSGFGDARLRLSFLPVGAPAANVAAFSKMPRSTIVGASVTVVMPTGAYDPSRLINVGANRWSFKPEVALSQPFADRWLLDLYAGLWLFTSNTTFYPGASLREQEPMGSFQGHISYTFGHNLWAAVNMTYYVGGVSTVNGLVNDDSQNNLRLGGTLVLPISGQHSIKIAASTGAVVRIGANFTTISLAWQSAFF